MKNLPNAIGSVLTRLALFSGSLFALSAGAQIISLNVRDGTVGGNSSVTTSFGIAAENTVVGNWINTNSFQTNINNLVNSLGNATTASAIIQNPGGQQYWGATYIGTPWNYGPALFPATATPVRITFSNLSTVFPQGYFALVYVNGSTANTGARVTDGTTTYFFRPSNPASTTPLLITTTSDPGAGNYTAGNYAKFGSVSSALTADSITFSIPNGSITNGNVGIGGVQLVAIPEPSTVALVIAAAALGVVALRRRRS